MDALDRGYLMAVCGALVWTPRLLRSWLDVTGSPRALLATARATLGPPGCPPLSDKARGRLAAIDDSAARAAWHDLDASGSRLVTDGDMEYPRALHDLSDRPPVLYVRGTLDALGEKAIAIVGSRAATTYGRETAAAFANDAGTAGACIVSGLARGVDAAAHKAALASDARTVAVVGSGLSALYPPYHSLLADDIVVAGGAVISEFPPRMEAAAYQFPMRNRVVAALAHATVVVEASARSGALITARLADELGRRVFAVPGDVGRPTSEGSNGLIKDGVPLVTSGREVVELMGWTRGYAERLAFDDPLLAHLDAPASAEELATALSIDLPQMLATLALMEIDGRVARLADGRFAAVKTPKPAKRRPR